MTIWKLANSLFGWTTERIKCTVCNRVFVHVRDGQGIILLNGYQALISHPCRYKSPKGS